MISELKSLRSELAEVKQEVAESRQSAEVIGARSIKENTKTRKVLEKWDADGQPETRE